MPRTLQPAFASPASSVRLPLVYGLITALALLAITLLFDEPHLFFWISMLAPLSGLLLWRQHCITLQLAKLSSQIQRDGLLRHFFTLPFIGMALTHPETKRWVHANDRLCAMLGYSADELAALTWLELTHPQDREADLAEFERLLRGEIDGYRLDKRFLHRDGHDIVTSMEIRPIRHANGRVESLLCVIEDITERRQAEVALRESEALFQTLANLAPVGIFRTDAAGHCRYLNARGHQIAGLTSSDELDACWLQRIHEADRDGVAQAWLRAVTLGQAFSREFRFRLPDQRDTWVMGVAEPERAPAGDISGYIGTLTDISSLKENAFQLQLAATVFENTREGIMITDSDNRILMVNPALSGLLGYSKEELLGQTPSLFRSGHQDDDYYRGMWTALEEKGHWRGEIWNRCKTGDNLPLLVGINRVPGEQSQRWHHIAVYTDITELKASEARLDYLARHDPLTGLANRLELQSRLEGALAHARRHKGRLALLLLDLDRFKDVNESFGHEVGDALLLQVAARLTRHQRPCDTLARLGGDEFLLLLEDNPQQATTARIADELLRSLNYPLTLPNRLEMVISASIGISLYPEHGVRPENLLQQADAALYQAKAEGRGCIRFFSDELTLAAQARLELESRLRQALARDEFSLHYQPQYDIHDGRLIGAEALLRWYCPDEGWIPPGRFIPVAEESGLIGSIGEWAILEACRQAQAWRQAGFAVPRVAVNLSPHQFRYVDIDTCVASILEKTGCPAEGLELEITESALMAREKEAVATLGKLRARGLTIAIDDFGTGYSSLAYLKQLPLDVLKIDKRFVDDIPHDRSGMEIAATIIAMAHTLGLRVLAEGVETEAQLAFLRDKGCDGVQGYLMRKPLPAEEFQHLLASQPPQATGRG